MERAVLSISYSLSLSPVIYEFGAKHFFVQKRNGQEL